MLAFTSCMIVAGSLAAVTWSLIGASSQVNR